MLVNSQWYACWLRALLVGYCLVALPQAADAGDKAATKAVSPMVPGFARFYQEAKGADLARGGRLLLGELSCVRCHVPEGGIEANVKSAPILDNVGARVKRAYLREFLTDPQVCKPGTTMPHVLAGLGEADKKTKVEALVHYLASTANPKPDQPDRKEAALGRDLYHQVGCVACHGTRDFRGNQDKLFASSVALGNLNAKYTLKSLKGFLENPHLVRPSGRMPGLLTGKEASGIANYLLQGSAPGSPAENMTFTYYEGAWKKLPDFGKTKPVATGPATDFDIAVARRREDCALKFEGFLRIEKAGNFAFHLTSDDGSKLWIGDKLVVDNDGIHGSVTKSAKVKLTKGVHKLVAGAFNAGGEFELRIEIEGGGLTRQPLGPLVQLKEKPEPVPAAAKDDAERFALQPALIAQGKELFTSLGCVQCHQLQKQQKAPSAPALAKLKGDGGCLADTPQKGIPWYGLNSPQRAALAAALQAPAPAKREPNEAIVGTMAAFNCYACHARDKIGGVEDDLNKYFLTTQPEMGDEARIPPALTGVGAKLTGSYLNTILDKGAHDRPYMKTRMPRFGAANAGHLAALYAKQDPLVPPTHVEFQAPLSKVKVAGRQMIGATAFGCIKCHTFAGMKAEGVQGMDLAIMTERLNKDWFHKYLLNPSKYRPGTRMPAAWNEDGTSQLTKVLDGTAATQIEAVWVYLADGKKAAPPVVTTKSSIPLVPVKEAILYRNFIKGAGTRGIAVGYPEKAHLAFDANEIYLAMIWQGGFIDAGKHWNGRGQGFAEPMGDSVLHLPAGPAFATLSQPDEPWPRSSAKQLGYKFLGYRLGDGERPTFLYSYKDVRIEDFPNAVESKGQPALRRKLTLSSPSPDAKLFFRAAVAKKIEAAGDGWFRIDDWRMRIESGAPPIIRTVADKMELLVPVRWQDNTATIVQEFVW